MAHTCPDCGQTCYCGEDIDDCLLDLAVDIARCTHYQTGCAEEYEDDDE